MEMCNLMDHCENGEEFEGFHVKFSNFIFILAWIRYINTFLKKHAEAWLTSGDESQLLAHC